MKKALNAMIALLCVAVALTGIQAQAQETTPPLVKQLYNGNWPSEDEAQQLFRQCGKA